MTYGPYPSDLSLDVKVLPRGARAVLPLADATAMHISTASRAWRPLPPGNVRLNGFDYEHWPATTTGDVILSWSHRNRVSQGSGASLVAQDFAGTYTPEGTITVEALVAGVVKRTWAGLTGTIQPYTLAERTADDADLGKQITFRITPINGAYAGTARTTPAFMMG